MRYSPAVIDFSQPQHKCFINVAPVITDDGSGNEIEDLRLDSRR